MKKPMKLKSVALLSILTVGVFVLIVRLSGKSISSPEGSSAETSVSDTAQMFLNQSAHMMVSSPVMPSNHLPRATSEELTALRRVFMATFMEQTASSRARGDFIFAGRSINPSTVGKARSFAKQHDADSMGAVSAFMVQLRDNPVSSDYKTLFGDVPLSSYVPPRGYVLMLTEAQLARVSALDSVEFVFEVTSDYKIDPFLAWLAEHSKRDILVDVLVNVYAEADERAVMQRVRALGVELERADSFNGVRRLKGVVALSILRDLAAIGGVEWIEKKAEMKLSNNLAVLAPRMNVVTVWNNWGLEGEGEIVGHADTGLDTGDVETLHLDMRGRVAGSATWNGRENWSDLDMHGTHTAGSIMGDGTASGGLFSGVAPKALLYHQSIGAANEELWLPDDLAFLFDEAAQNGAYIHSDSWGDSIFGLYSIYEEMVDTYVWGNQEFLPVFAAGNDGTDGYYPSTISNYLADAEIVISDALKNGVIDSQSIGSPSQAKNALAVGATESDRTDGPQSTRSYGSMWPKDFSVNPIKSDLATVGSISSNGYFQGMAAFSSRGPTYGGRMKPDVTAPGCNVISTRSSMSAAGTGWGVYGPNPVYLYSGGTSMACPLAAGAAALIREHLVKREGVEAPTAALIRAVMVNGAESIFPGQYGTGAFQEIPNHTPNPVEGWGQVNVGNTLYKTGTASVLIDRISEGQWKSGERVTWSVNVINTNVPLRITLTWADYSLRPWAAYNYELVNDLDLKVETPAMEVFWGNGVEDGDRLNTTERIMIENPELGTYTVSVVATNIMVRGSLPALAMTGGIEGVAPIVVPKLIEDTVLKPEGYSAQAHIHAVFPYTGTNPVDFAWALGNENMATGGWTHVSIVAEEDDETYQTVIGGPLVVGEVYYVWDVPGAVMPLTNRFSIVPYDVVPAMFSQIFTYIGGTTNLSVQANTAWFAQSTNAWIAVSVGAGTNAGAVVYRVMTNEVAILRSGEILVFGADITNTVSVLQGAWDKEPDPPQLDSPVFSMNGGEASLSFMGERNVVYTLQGKESLADPEWIDLDTQTSYNDAVVTLTVVAFPESLGLPDTAFFRIKAVALAAQ